MDLRYEFYPTFGETVSLGLFYKHFKNPIEWTFIDMGGSLRYLFENADQADNYGVEIEMRKKLDFIKMPDFTLVVNAALIKSNVHFTPGEVLIEPDRPMQGQSPYIINAGLYYHSKEGGWDVALLYNRIGKRIVGLGKSNNPNGDINSMIPDSYEMPRNVLDFTLSKTIGKHVELRLSIKDFLSEDLIYKQFPKFEKEGVIHHREQITRKYNPGQSLSLGVNVKLN
jgi:outer membrane receptor protein involved in Fe transport